MNYAKEILESYYKKYYSHPNKSLYKHIKEIEFICKTILNILNLKEETKLKIYRILDDLIFYHDLGKASKKFQDYLDGKIKKAEHSSYSFLIYSIINRKEIKNSDKLKSLTAFLILKHHSSLNNNFNVGLEDDLIIDNLIVKIVGRKIGIKEKNDFLRRIFEKIKLNLINNFTLEDYLITLFAFGVFLLADRISASITENWNSDEELEVIIKNNGIIKNLNKAYSKLDYSKFLEFIENLQKNNSGAKINKLRTKAFKEVEENFRKNENLNMFKITLPTGLGKTFTGLNIALLINQKIKRPIIYSLPFLSIIEQNFNRIKSIYNEETGKFHHLSFFDNDENESLKDFINFELKPITITTLVQIFNSLITNNRNWIIKFPFVATSILIIDETQNLPIGCFKDFENLFKLMIKLFDTKVILMSATQPYILEEAKELIKNKEDYYIFNRYKIEILDFFDENNLNYEKFTEFIIEKLKEKNKVGIIVNKVKDSIKLFKMLNKKLNFKEINTFKFLEDKLEEEIKHLLKIENKINSFLKDFGLVYEINRKFKEVDEIIKNNLKKFNLNGKEFFVLYLSANLINLEKKIRTLILDYLKDKNLLVVSTQVIEAGIDIDLDVLFRFIAPLDSLIQSAGRVNRNGFMEPKGELFVIADLKGDRDKNLYKNVYHQKLIIFTKDLLVNLKEKNEKSITNPNLIERHYFACIRGKKECVNSKKEIVQLSDEKCILCEENNKKIRKTLKELVLNFSFNCIGKFSLVEDKSLITYVLDFNYNLLKLSNEFYEKIKNLNKKEKIEKIKKFKELIKIEEFFSASRIKSLNNPEKIKNETEELVELLNSKKELNKKHFKFYFLVFIDEKKFYYKFDKKDINNDLLIFYDFFGFKELEEKKDENEIFIII